MKYLGLIILLLSHSVLAYCPEDDQAITITGKLVSEIHPGPPNWESVKEGDEAVTNDFLQLEDSFTCAIASDQPDYVPEVQLIFLDESKNSYNDVSQWLNKEVMVTGKVMYAQTGWHFTVVTILVDEVKEIASASTPEEKKSMLLQLQNFQQALKAKDILALKSYFVFPFSGDAWGMLPNIEPAPDRLTEAEFDRHSDTIISNLQNAAELNIDPEKLAISEYRINTLTPEEQSRHYFPGDEDGKFYYEEKGKRIEVNGTCDIVVNGEFEDNSLTVYLGTGSNKQIPGLSEVCDGASGFNFKLIDGKLRLVSSFSAD